MKLRSAAAVLATALCGLYYALLRRAVLTWGATDAEAAARLPGDELLEDADGVSTRHRDQCAGRRGVAMACADGSLAARQRVHL
jgi:hypothetical protein